MREEQRRGSSKFTGTSFVGTALSVYVSFIHHTPVFVSGCLTEMIGACVQEDRLWIADPKAINHILQKSGYLYAKLKYVREAAALTTGPGIIWAEGEFHIVTRLLSYCLPNNPTGNVHKRQRRAMAPAFGLVEAKGLLPYFMDSVTKARELRLYLILGADSGPRRQMADKWNNIIENSNSGHSAVIDVNMWFGRATLDAYVSVPVTGVRGSRTNHGLISQKGRCWGFRVRLRRLRGNG